MGGFDWTRSSGLKIRSTLVEADGDINSRHIRRGGEYRSCSSYTEDENITRPRYPKYPSTSSLSQVSDSICTKSSITMVYICPRCYSTQLESCAAQMCNVLAGVLGGVVLVLWVVVLVGLVLVRFPAPLVKRVGRTKGLKQGNFPSMADCGKNVHWKWRIVHIIGIVNTWTRSFSLTNLA